MSFTISINSCQTICLSFANQNCTFLPLTWTINGPQIISISANDKNAIISGIFGFIGTTFVNITDSAGTNMVLTVNVLAAPGFGTVVNPKYQYVFATNVTAISGSTHTSGTIVGPFPTTFQPNVCTFLTPTTTTTSPLQGSVFTAASFPFIFFQGGFAAIPNSMDFVIFKPTVNVNIDQILIFSDVITNISPFSLTGGISNFNVVLPGLPLQTCKTATYISMVQYRTFPGSAFVLGSQYINSTVRFGTNNATPGDFSVILAPNNFYNTLSTSLIYSQITQVVILSSPQTLNITISPITLGLVSWIVQPNDISSNGIAINFVTQTTTTNLQVNVSVIQGTIPISIKIAQLAYKLQSNSGYVLNLP